MNSLHFKLAIVALLTVGNMTAQVTKKPAVPRDLLVIQSDGLLSGGPNAPEEGLEKEFKTISAIFELNDVIGVIVLGNNTQMPDRGHLWAIQQMVEARLPLLSVNTIRNLSLDSVLDWKNPNSRCFFRCAWILKNGSVVHFMYWHEFIRVHYKGKDAILPFTKSA